MFENEMKWLAKGKKNAKTSHKNNLLTNEYATIFSCDIRIILFIRIVKKSMIVTKQMLDVYQNDCIFKYTGLISEENYYKIYVNITFQTYTI